MWQQRNCVYEKKIWRLFPSTCIYYIFWLCGFTWIVLTLLVVVEFSWVTESLIEIRESIIYESRGREISKSRKLSMFIPHLKSLRHIYILWCIRQRCTIVIIIIWNVSIYFVEKKRVISSLSSYSHKEAYLYHSIHSFGVSKIWACSEVYT